MDDDNYYIELLMRMVGMMINDQRSESIICVKFEVRRNIMIMKIRINCLDLI